VKHSEGSRFAGSFHADLAVEAGDAPLDGSLAQRADFHHKTALALVRENDTIYHEDLQTANMVKNHHLATSISDAGWSAFLSILAAKAAYAGRRVVAVPPAYTSQTCSGCGVLVAKGLSIRWRSCPDCGMSLHRDHNAAKNIEQRGQSRRGAVA
jgi:putative transposase